MSEYFQIVQNAGYLPVSNILVESSLYNKQANLEAVVSNGYESYSNYQPNNFAVNSNQIIITQINENTNFNHQTGFQNIENTKLDEVRYQVFYNTNKDDTRLYHAPNFSHQHPNIFLNQPQISLNQSNFKQNEREKNMDLNEEGSENEDDEEVSDQIFPWMKRAHGLCC
jgi:hypothetical protein